MGELEEHLIRRAIRKHNKIFPCACRKNLESCFTREKDRLLFWYNTKDRSTHVISARMISDRPVSRRTTANRVG